MKKLYNIVLLLAATLFAQHAVAQPYNSYNNTITGKPFSRYESNWQLNVGIGYGNYYGDMSRYNIRSFSDVGYLRNFVGFNKNYIKEPSFHLSVVKRLGLSSTGIGFNLNRTLIQGSDRYISGNGKLETNDPNFSRSLNFKTDIVDAGLSFNLNGFNKGFFAPYLTFGAGFSFFDVRGDLFNGSNQNIPYNYNNQQNVNDGFFETKLRDELTETDEKYPNTVLYFQGLLGFNFRLSNNFSLAVESDVKYSGSDYLDDVSGQYKSSYPNQRSQYIAKPGNNGTSLNGNRGRNDGVNDFYIQNRIVFRFHIPKYLKHSQIKNQTTDFNAPVLYPSNYYVPVDSAAYMRAMMKVNGSAASRADSMRRHMTDSIRMDSVRRAQPVNVKMDSSFTNEIKALRKEVAGLRQTIDRNSTQKTKDSVAIQRVTLRDSLNRNLQKIQQKKKKTGFDSLQQQIYQLRLDSIALAEKYASQNDTVTVTNQAMAQSTTAPATTVTNINRSREDSLQRVVDSLRKSNAITRPAQQQSTQISTQQPVKTVSSVRDTLSPVQVQQYQQQVAGLAYRSRITTDSRQTQARTDSIRRVNEAIRTSDSLKVQYYQTQLAQAQQQETDVMKTERRGLLVKKSDTLKKAETNRKEAEAKLQTAQIARQQDIQNSQVATGDTVYIANLRTQLNARQTQIDSLKNSKKVTDIFTDKNKRIKELEQQQQDQQRQVDDANRMLQYYRNTGPTSNYQPQYYPQQPYNYDRNAYTNYQNPPVNVVSPVVVSGNDDERRRMQREIDSLRNQVTQLRQTPVVQNDSTTRSVMLDSTVNRPVTRTPAYEMAALQRQLAELNNRLNAASRPIVAVQPTATDTSNSSIAATVYFNRGSVILSTLQKAKLTAILKKAKKTYRFQLIASSDNTTGNIAANELLARRRATATATYLKSRGITASRISTTVKANNGGPDGKPDPLARRVDVFMQ